MSSVPSLGAHGRPATFSGSCGMPCAAEVVPKAEAKAFANEGSKEGGPSPIPSEARSGAFSTDESVSGYTGDPRKNT